MSPIKLFIELINGEAFHFGDRPDRIMVKSDPRHYVAPPGQVKVSHPHVAVFSDTIDAPTSIFDRKNGEKNGK